MRRNTMNLSHSRDLGKFYTPRPVAQVLADWAITSSDATVLDPSFGGCAFLCAALTTLQQNGRPLPGRQIYGVDIDPEARRYLKPLYNAGAQSSQFVTEDFFNIPQTHFDRGLFDAVVGNPPYVRYHSIPTVSQKLALRRLEELDIELSGRASYWALFLLYAMHFLKPGGRMAMILPGAFLHTDYSARVRKALIEHFEQVTILLLRERIFKGTQEETVFVCASGAQLPHRNLRISAIDEVKELQASLQALGATTLSNLPPDGGGEWLRALLDPNTLEIYDHLTQSETTVKMGDWAASRIGVVTGRNKFFILSSREKNELGIVQRYLKPVVMRPQDLTGLWVRDDDLEHLAKSDRKWLLLTIEEMKSSLPRGLQEYLECGHNTGVSQGRKCRDREPWYAVSQTFTPPAFIQCMSAGWPRVVVNHSKYTCTNNILRLQWKETRPMEDWLRLAIGSLSTLSQLSAELVGRSYGGGVLKLEPSDLSKLVIPLLPHEVIDSLSHKAHQLLQEDKMRDATELVDRALIKAKQLKVSDLNQLRSARDRLLLRRRVHRNDVSRFLSKRK